jgi:hypothetical protein
VFFTGHTEINVILDLMSTFSDNSCCEASTNLYFPIVTSLVVNCLTTTQLTAVAQFECEMSQNFVGKKNEQEVLGQLLRPLSLHKT